MRLSEYSTTDSGSEHSAQNADSHLSDSAAAAASRSTRGDAGDGVATCCTGIGETWK